MSGPVFDMWMVKELAFDLSKAGAEAEIKARAAVAKTALDGVKEAKYEAPVDTGFLRSSISAEINGLEAEWGPTASYGIYVEHGTSRMAGQPYLGPSYDAVTPNFVKAMEQIGGEILG